MKESNGGGAFQGFSVPWIAVAVVAIGLLAHVGGGDERDAPSLSSAFASVGAVAALLGVGGLIAVALQTPSGWRSAAMRWLLVTLGGVVLITPGWGTAAALAGALFAMAWAGADERY